MVKSGIERPPVEESSRVGAPVFTVRIQHRLSENFSSFCRPGNWIPERVMGVQMGIDDLKQLEICLLLLQLLVLLFEEFVFSTCF